MKLADIQSYRGDEFAIIFDSDFVAYMPSNEGPLEVSRMD